MTKYPDRAEADRFFNYPYVAIEEALANAVYHRAYDIREPIEVRIEPDKIEILSFPGPDRSITMENLRTFKVTNRRYRNRRIGEMLKELHLTEGRENIPNVLNRVPNVPNQENTLSEMEEKILALIAENPIITSQSIAEQCKVSRKTVTRVCKPQPTLSAWEGERKSPSIDGLENMANLYGVTTDFLLGRSIDEVHDLKQPILMKALPAFHGRPVWSATYGWLLVNAADKHVTFPDGRTLPFVDITCELFIFAPPFSEAEPPKEPPLTRSEISGQKEIWLEPISPDSELRRELQGWYQVKDRFVENEYGNRFYLDTYGSKWLAFHSETAL